VSSNYYISDKLNRKATFFGASIFVSKKLPKRVDDRFYDSQL